MNDTSGCELPSFQSAFINREYGNVIPLASTNESYKMSNLANNMQFANQLDGDSFVCNEAQINIGSLQDYSEWIDASKSIQPSNLLSEPLDLSNQKQSPRSTQQTKNEVETVENTSVSTPRIIYENPPVENFELEFIPSSSLNKRFCPECGTEITPKSKLYQPPEVLKDSVSPTENPQSPQRTSSPKKTTLIRTEDVVDFCPSEPVINDNHPDLFTKKSIIQSTKLKCEGNADTDNAPIVLIAAPETHLKRQSVVHSSLSTSRSKTELSTQDQPEVQVAAGSMLKIKICPDCGNIIIPNSRFNPYAGVLNGCTCQRKDISGSSSKTSLNHTDVLYVADSSHSQPTFTTTTTEDVKQNSPKGTSLNQTEDVLDVDESSSSQLIISKNQKKRITRKNNIQRRKLNHETDSDADYVPEVAISPITGYPKTHLKRKCVRSGFSTSRNETEKFTQDELAAKIAASLMLKKQICPDCGNKITPDSNLNHHSGVLNVCACQRKDISGSSSKTSLNHTDVLYVADSSHSQPTISDNQQKSFQQKSYLQGQNLNPEGNTDNDNSSESSIAEWTSFTKIDIKRESVVHSGTTRNKSEKSDSDELEFQVAATAKQKNICPICGKDFMKKSKLLRHSVVHTGEKPYLCNLCGKGYAQKCYLIRHRVTHTDEKPFKCDICGKAFSQQCNLKRHSVVHPGYKPFNCGICLKGFAFKGDVFKHILTHTTEKRIKYEF